MLAPKLTSLAALTGLILITGCATPSQRATLTSGSLPPDKYLVGGGYLIDWVAPDDGVLIIADRSSKKIISTNRLLRNGDSHFTLGTDGNMKKLEELLGVPLKNASIQAFWIPDEAKPQTLTAKKPK